MAKDYIAVRDAIWNELDKIKQKKIKEIGRYISEAEFLDILQEYGKPSIPAISDTPPYTFSLGE